ncbi:hypothetical protein ACFQ2B_28965 [Streptomyces stramineus]
MEWFTASGYGLSRLILQRGLAALYAVAFLGAALQFRALIGERGMLPVPRFLRGLPFLRAPGSSSSTTPTASSPPGRGRAPPSRWRSWRAPRTRCRSGRRWCCGRPCG